MTRPPRWTAAETEHLLGLAGDYPWPMLPLLYNRWAKANGYPRRTEVALRLRIDDQGGALTAVGAWITTGSIATTLGIHHATPAYWCQRHPTILQPFQRKPDPRSKRQRGGYIYVRRDRLRAFGRQCPDQLGGLPLGPLVMVLEDANLAERILEAYPNRPQRASVPVPVRCVDTGQVFPSQTAAGAACHISPSAIGEACRGRNKTAAGFRWERLEAVA